MFAGGRYRHFPVFILKFWYLFGPERAIKQIMIPLNTLLIVFLVLFGITTGLDLLLESLNRRHVKTHGHRVPQPFEGWLAPERQVESSRYTAETIRFSMLRTLSVKALFLIVLLSGILPDLAALLAPLPSLPAGLIFFAVLGLASTLFAACFDFYRCFVLEEKYGFNARTPQIWLTDLLKSILLTAVIGSLLISAALLLIRFAPETWWMWAWLCFTGFQLAVAVIFPTWIAPLFNKFTSVEDIELKDKIAGIAQSQGINVSGIFQMDASKRTRHTNAYLSGLGKTKRIVLFDSLIQAHDHEEISAILAHEIGHFKQKHIVKMLLIHTLATLFFLFLASKLINWPAVYQSFGFSNPTAFAGLFLIGVLWEPVGWLFSPLFNFISRYFEREADRLAVSIAGTARPLVRALKKMAADNLSNLHPHPFYTRFNYSHPPILERIKQLEAATGEHRHQHV